ncbi:MAG: hypothetical protein CL581_10685 [Alteromonadaceae bacterium]|nr:hypothetical protein [Alteromonadaceae bacterium]MBH86731.1 hypothetical protein [Alteromonadaceae bacterium]
MKHWQRFAGTLVALATVAAWMLFSDLDQKPDNDDQQQRSAMFSGILDDLSKSWGMTELQSMMQPRALAADEAVYRDMLESASALGRFVGCERLQLGDFASSALDQPPFNRLDVDRVYQGNGECAFEKGSAYVLVGYLPGASSRPLVLLEVDRVRLYDR